MGWLMGEREPHGVCRVEGADDVLLVDALLDWSRHTMRTQPAAWNGFVHSKGGRTPAAQPLKFGWITRMRRTTPAAAPVFMR